MRSRPPTSPGTADQSGNGHIRPRLRDRRLRPFLVPNYLIDVFGARLRPAGIALYVALCRHAGADNACFPSFSTLGEETGMHRSTVIRTLRRLLSLKLIQRTVRRDERYGQRANLYTLVDPDLPALDPPPQDGGGSSTVRPPQAHYATPPVALCDPPSSTVRPTLNEGIPSEGSPVRESAPPPDSSPFDQRLVGTMVALWLDLLTTRGRGIRADHAAEIASEAAELLRLGWTADQLIESINAADRPRWEWPREWRARLVASRSKAARTPPDPAQVAEKRAQAAEAAVEAARSAAELLGGKTLSEFAKQRKKKP
jgi:Helix-turn-helix domain